MKMGAPLPELKWADLAVQARKTLKDHYTGRISAKETVRALSDSGVPATAEVNNEHATVTEFSTKKQKRSKEYALDILKKLFGGFKEKIDFVPGALHPKYEGSFHPANYAAYLTIEEVCKKIVDPNNIKLLKDYVFSSENLNGSFALIGGPYSNYLSSLILQYKQISPGKQEQGLKRETDPVVRLKYQFSCDPRDLQLRDVRSAPDMEEPNWIILNTEDENDFLVPDVDEINGEYLQRSDYLVVYALPNFINIEAYNEGKKIFLFCGTHGTGTMAIDLLFQDREILNSLYEYFSKEGYCEAVFKINSIDRSQGLLQPRSLSKESENIRFAIPTFDDTSLRKWVNNLPYKKKYTQGAELSGIDRIQNANIVEEDSSTTETSRNEDEAKLQGGSKEFFSNHHEPKGTSLPLGAGISGDSLGEGNTMSHQQNEHFDNIDNNPENPPSQQPDTRAIIYKLKREDRTFYLVEETGPKATPYGFQFAHTQNGKIALFNELSDVKTYIAKCSLTLESEEIYLDLNEILGWINSKNKNEAPTPLEILREAWNAFIVVAAISHDTIQHRVNQFTENENNNHILFTLAEGIELSKPATFSIHECNTTRVLFRDILTLFDNVSEVTG